MNININEIDKFVEKMMLYHDIPGLAVGIGKDEQLVINKSYGYKNIETKEVLKDNCVFHMASVTKLLVGTSIMQLAEKGAVNIEEKVVNYIPYFKIDDERYKDITVKQMLSHISGMPDIDDYGWDNPEFDELALERFVKSITDLKLLWDPGYKFQYSNVAYEILGDLISKVSKMTFEEYVHKNIFKALGMTNSSLLTFERDRNEIVTPHTKDEEKNVIISKTFPYNRAHSPSSTLTSNVEDLSKWAFASINKGTYGDAKILEEETYNKMWTPQKDINEREQIGLSWFIRKHRDLQVYGHEGSDIGFRTSFAIVPEENLFVSVHTNIQSAPTRRIQKGILDILYGYEPEIK